MPFSRAGWTSSVLEQRQTHARGRRLSCQEAKCRILLPSRRGFLLAMLTGDSAACTGWSVESLSSVTVLPGACGLSLN